MFERSVEQGQWPLEVEALSGSQALQQVQDGRHKRGVRCSVAAILTLLLLAK